MKDILVTGYNRIIKEILWSDLAKDFRVIAADRELPRRNDGNVRFYSISPEEEASASFLMYTLFPQSFLYPAMWTAEKAFTVK